MGATAIPLVLANFRQIFIFVVQIDLCLSLAIRFVSKDMIIDKSLFASFSLHRTQFANPISGFTKMSKFFFLSRLKVSFKRFNALFLSEQFYWRIHETSIVLVDPARLKWTQDNANEKGINCISYLFFIVWLSNRVDWMTLCNKGK